MTIATTAPIAGVERSSMNSIVFASCFGTIIEWYDFLIYATAAALVFNKAFFPTFDPLAGTLAALGSYAVGFLARPLGGPEREDLGWDASRHWCIRFTAPPGLRAEGRVIRICFDVAQRLPAEVEIEDDAGFLESYRYLHVTPAPGEAASFNLAAAGVP